MILGVLFLDMGIVVFCVLYFLVKLGKICGGFLISIGV